MSLQLLVARKPFRTDKENFDDDSDRDDDLLHKPRDSGKMFDTIAGEGEDVETEDEDLAGVVIDKPKVTFELADLQSMLARNAEIEEAGKPGRPKEAHKQMKAFPQIYHQICSERLQLPAAASGPSLLMQDVPWHASEVEKHQHAVATSLRDKENATNAPPALPEGMHEQTWRDMHKRNAQRDKPRCETVPLEDIARGPGHVAWQLIENHKIRFNDEQIDGVALEIWPVELAFRNQMQNNSSNAPPLAQRRQLDVLPGASVLSQGQLESIRRMYLLPNDLGLPRTFIVGGGGCGKTTIMLDVISPTLETFFDRVVRAAPSNKAARHFKAKTVHSLNGLRPQDSLRAANLRIRNETVRKKMDALQCRAGAYLIDEVGQLQAQLLHASCVLWTIARSHIYLLNLQDYARPGEIAGRVSKMCLMGDHLQLPPVPKETSLLAPLENTNDEHKAGAGIFANVDNVFLMSTMMRFRDECLRRILEKMRTPNGARLSEQEWKALMDTNVDASPLDGQRQKAYLDKTADWYHSSYLWSLTTLISYATAKLSAKAAQKTLFYVQAVDNPKKHIPANILGHSKEHSKEAVEDEAHRRLLQVPNLNTTKRLPGIACFHKGMRIRVTTSVLPPWAVQDSAGQIEHIDLHPTDQAILKSLPTVPAEHRLRYPPNLYVRLDDVDHEFLPPTICPQHVVTGFDSCCHNCKCYPGLIQVKPKSCDWYYKDNEWATMVKRLQLPIMPEKACNLYGLQGTTAEPGLVAHFEMPQRLDKEIKWLIVYVMLSRVRDLNSLASFGLDDKIRAIIEGGPPENLVSNFDRLFKEKAAKTKVLAREYCPEDSRKNNIEKKFAQKYIRKTLNFETTS